jgi:hypothetical protein
MARSIVVGAGRRDGADNRPPDVCRPPYIAISRCGTLVRLFSERHETAAMTTSIPRLRAHLERLDIDHAALSDTEVFHLACALRGWHVTPRTGANTGPIDARVWLAAALATGGRYRAPEVDGHPAELGDGGPLVDSIALMAIVQRHFLDAPARGWDDDTLAAQLGLEPIAVARAQMVLDDVSALVRRARPPLGPGWWTRRSPARA